MFETERLLLRGWRASDRAPFAAMNADPEVMRYIPSVLTRAESDERLERIVRALEQDGFGLWAVEERSSQRFLGFTGLARPAFDAHFTPAVEIGWRLARDAWGHGFATEAARAAVVFAFDELGLAELVSFTAVENARSRAVMRRLRMRHDAADDFDHPTLPPGHPLRRHVLYRLSSGQGPSQWGSWMDGAWRASGGNERLDGAPRAAGTPRGDHWSRASSTHVRRREAY